MCVYKDFWKNQTDQSRVLSLSPVEKKRKREKKEHKFINNEAAEKYRENKTKDRVD